MSSIFSDENRVSGASWFKFKNIGDAIEGVVESVSIKPASGIYQQQIVVTLVVDGALVNVPLRYSLHNESRVSQMEKGDRAGFKYTGTTASRVQGGNACKLVDIFHQKARPAFFEKSFVPKEEV